MEFLFLNDKYALRFGEDEVPYLNHRLNMLFGESVTKKGEVTADHIAGERDLESEWREDMVLDGWILSVYPPKGESMKFIKCFGDYDVTVRAINSATGIYEMVTIDVVEAVEILRDLAAFIASRPQSQNASIENGFEVYRVSDGLF